MSPRFRQLLQEPTLHFLGIAVLVFIAYAVLNSSEGKQLEIDPREIQARIFMREMATGNALSEAEQQAVRDAYIEEQILVQEALAMNLDNDARIHDLLAQKMRHVLSGDVIQPSDEQLQAFYEANAEQYRIAERLNLDELVFDTRESLGPELLSLINSGAAAREMLALEAGNVSSLDNATHQDLRNIFSAEFADQVFAAEIAQWRGPFLSNRGQHWLRIRERQAARLPTLAELRERVRLDWISIEEETLLQEKIDALRSEYELVAASESHE